MKSIIIIRKNQVKDTNHAILMQSRKKTRKRHLMYTFNNPAETWRETQTGRDKTKEAK